MASSDNQAPDDVLLTRYLLGALPDKEAERLDELSIADEAFAGRLDAVEHDLVDAYVRGELSEDDLKQFKAFYLSSPGRRQKVRFAQGLLEFEHRAAAMPAILKPQTDAPASAAERQRPQSPSRMLLIPRLALPWGFAAASLAILILGGFLLFQNLQLRSQLAQEQVELNSADQRALELETQLNQERIAKDEALQELAHGAPPQTDLDQLKTVAVLLPPPMRGAAQIPTISLHPGTDLVVLVLPLESDDFPAYRAKLRDPADNRVLWSSTRLTAARGVERKTVSVSFRAGLLKQQNYIVDLTGIPNHGAAEVISGYPFHVVLH
jgi:hypothetical protein